MKGKKLQKISSSDKADVSALLNNGLENSPGLHSIYLFVIQLKNSHTILAIEIQQKQMAIIHILIMMENLDRQKIILLQESAEIAKQVI